MSESRESLSAPANRRVSATSASDARSPRANASPSSGSDQYEYDKDQESDATEEQFEHRGSVHADDLTQIPKYLPYNSLTPCTNRWLKKRWDDHAQQKHRERIANIGSAIDNTRPVGFQHKFDAKQQKIKQQRAEEIHQQNLKILQKLSKIASRKNATFSSPGHQPPFHEKRIRELKSIQEQNLHILRRIIDISTDKRSPYSRTKLLKSAEANQSLVARISVYPPQPSISSSSHTRPWLGGQGPSALDPESDDGGYYYPFEDDAPYAAHTKKGHSHTKGMRPIVGWTVDQLDGTEETYMVKAEEILAKSGRKPTGPTGVRPKSAGKALSAQKRASSGNNRKPAFH
ncbi:hypothetical protein M427DRAFT_179326 [Gonapodya prolifera JEL478]|uniref:Uncharacterized protein n=1 Tax=Gonapodya prolifera (strain JEL478) TaxID=1344416 RepID=A0A139AQA3_GONPJ|nr:hypothetical protein M427DRAFT_179326 [Gonapodya prolifera JEL478]|eukprot:KXS18908.1 hypothetical protein M427DRAFT_179326 [Gonapodya prolifera JEL478]